MSLWRTISASIGIPLSRVGFALNDEDAAFAVARAQKKEKKEEKNKARKIRFITEKKVRILLYEKNYFIFPKRKEKREKRRKTITTQNTHKKIII